MRLFRRALAGGMAACLLLAVARPALATNATNLINHGAASGGMGGTDAAIFHDTSAINSNPAALSLMPTSSDRDPASLFSAGRLDFTGTILNPFLHHEDQFNNDRDGENEPVITLNGGAAVRLRGLPEFTFGAGLFTQGGLSSHYKGLNTVFGTRDDVSSSLRFVKLAAAVSWQPTDQFAVAVSPYVGYSDVHFRLFPKTSSNGADGVAGTADDFAGIDMSNECARNWGLGVPGGTCPWDVVFGVRAGAVFKVTPTVTIGAVYNSPVEFNYRDGRMKLNFSNVGLGRVEYDSAVDGFKWPQSVEAGIAWRPTPRWLLGLDFAWHDWSTFNRLVITASNPDTPGAPARVRIPVNFDWHDQFVVSVGAAYEVVPDVFTLRGGYNFGNNQVPDRTLSPTVCVIYEHHLTAGAGYRPNRNLQLDLAFVYTLENKVTYTNRGQPFGTNAVSAPAGLHVDLTLGYRF